MIERDLYWTRVMTAERPRQVVHAYRAPGTSAACGAGPNPATTTSAGHVTCSACKEFLAAEVVHARGREGQRSCGKSTGGDARSLSEVTCSECLELGGVT